MAGGRSNLAAIKTEGGGTGLGPNTLILPSGLAAGKRLKRGLRLIVAGTNGAGQIPLKSLPVVYNGSRDEENTVPRIREHPGSRCRAIDLGERQVGCVQNSEIMRHHCAVACHAGELPRVGEVGRRFERRETSRRSHRQSGESSGPIERACVGDGAGGAESYRACAVLRGEHAVDRAVHRPTCNGQRRVGYPRRSGSRAGAVFLRDERHHKSQRSETQSYEQQLCESLHVWPPRSKNEYPAHPSTGISDCSGWCIVHFSCPGHNELAHRAGPSEMSDVPAARFCPSEKGSPPQKAGRYRIDP